MDFGLVGSYFQTRCFHVPIVISPVEMKTAS